MWSRWEEALLARSGANPRPPAASPLHPLPLVDEWPSRLVHDSDMMPPPSDRGATCVAVIRLIEFIYFKLLIKNSLLPLCSEKDRSGAKTCEI